ncbi:MAG TPA: hypothetical protein GXX58_11240, partial [Gelria sp.]|nr:hypothetical protein [Gelria sp.]
IVDYSEGYPYGKPIDLGFANFKELKSGKITINGKEVVSTPQSSIYRARKIASTLKEWIKLGDFELTKPVAPLPSADANIEFKSIPKRSPNGNK